MSLGPMTTVMILSGNRVNIAVIQVTANKAGARFTKHFKPKIFLSAIQFVWHLRKS